VPSERTARCPSPRSMPTSGVISGRTYCAPVLPTKRAEYRPALSLTYVTDDSTEGTIRDHLPLTSPIYDTRSFPPAVTDQRAFAVKRTDCRVSRFDLYRGAPMRGRLPFRPSKKFRYAVSRSRSDCWRTTAETSPSQARSGVFFA